MAFSDGIYSSKIWDSIRIHRATYSDGREFYFLSSCGNLCVAEGDEEFRIPTGWKFTWESGVEVSEKQTPNAQDAQKGEK